MNSTSWFLVLIASVMLPSKVLAVCACTYTIPKIPIFGPGTNGCQITSPAAAKFACQCTWTKTVKSGTITNTCSGAQVACNNLLNLDKYGWNLNLSQYCTKPDTSFYSCMVGGGSCGGYSGNYTVAG